MENLEYDRLQDLRLVEFRKLEVNTNKQVFPHVQTFKYTNELGEEFWIHVTIYNQAALDILMNKHAIKCGYVKDLENNRWEYSLPNEISSGRLESHGKGLKFMVEPSNADLDFSFVIQGGTSLENSYWETEWSEANGSSRQIWIYPDVQDVSAYLQGYTYQWYQRNPTPAAYCPVNYYSGFELENSSGRLATFNFVVIPIEIGESTFYVGGDVQTSKHSVTKNFLDG